MTTSRRSFVARTAGLVGASTLATRAGADMNPGQQDAWSKQVERWGATVSSDEHDIPQNVVDLALEVMKFPRHLGIHSGGMVLTRRPVGEVVPIEHARKEKRTVVQWDKDDCAWMGLVKFDLLTSRSSLICPQPLRRHFPTSMLTKSSISGGISPIARR